MKFIEGVNRLKLNGRLVAFDLLVYIVCCLCCYLFPSAYIGMQFDDIFVQSLLLGIFLFLFRFIFKIYYRIWRYEGVSGYLSMTISDVLSLMLFLIIQMFLPFDHSMRFIYVVIALSFLLLCLVSRFLYRYIYKYGSKSRFFKLFYYIIYIMTLGGIRLKRDEIKNKINIAIIGAGRTGQSLAEELNNNPEFYYNPVMFVDTDKDKVGKTINNIPIHAENDALFRKFYNLKVKEIVFSFTDLDDADRKKLFEYYKKSGCKVKVYDGPKTLNASGKIQLREFDIEDLMPRPQVVLNDKKMNAYYSGKTVLVTGGGGSIGSEIARQVWSFNPKELILLDICENGVYDVEQEIKSDPNFSEENSKQPRLSLEICSIVDKDALDRVFKKYHPDIVIHAAAHKHVPLMENNAVEAVQNNIVGTKNVIDMSEEYEIDKFMLVSSDKAVNPTNVMGATKRFCEMLVQAANINGKVDYAATRFGNVLGSAGSVVPLFRRQISKGGPITITNKNIIRYFMTIPEACSLVLEASVLSKSGELFVLDMGEPVHIIDLAKNMIDISNAKNIDIVETGLRPGEKLYEELLIDSENCTKTDNKLIFIEKEEFDKEPLEIDERYKKLCDSIKSNSNDKVKETLMHVVDEYKKPEEVNYKIINAK